MIYFYDTYTFCCIYSTIRINRCRDDLMARKKIKHVRFSVYKAVMKVEKSNDVKLQKLNEKIDELNSFPKLNWHQRKSLEMSIQKRDKRQRYANEKSSMWNLKEPLDAVIDGRITKLVMQSFGENVELDRSTIYHKDGTPHLYAFQLSRLREDNLPAKKKIGKERVHFDLEDDEYVGEFTEVLYDSRYNLVIVQTNRDGVGFPTVVHFLNMLRKEYLAHQGVEDDKALYGELQLLLDPCIVDKALRASMYNRISIRCSDINADSILPDEVGQLAAVKNTMKEKKGIVIDFDMKMLQIEPAEYLDEKEIHIAGKRFLEYINNPNISSFEKKNAGMEIYYCDDTNRRQEAVDLLIPKVTFFVSVTVEKRKAVGSEELYDLTVIEYEKLNSKLIDLQGSGGRNEKESSEIS